MKPQKRLYSPHAVALGTLMGSLLAGIVLLVLNYSAMARQDLAKRVVLLGVVVQVAFLAAAALLPDVPWAAMAVMVAQTVVAFVAADYLQGKMVRYHLEQGGELHSSLRAVGVGFLVALVFVMVVVVLVALTGITPPAATPA